MKESILVILFLIVHNVHAGGSFRLDTELRPILETNPKLMESVFASFDLAESGGANRIGISRNNILGGHRLGPYYLNAKPKGHAGNYTFTVVFHTEIELIGGNDKATDDLRSAVKINEHFHSYEVLPLGKVSAKYSSDEF